MVIVAACILLTGEPAEGRDADKALRHLKQLSMEELLTIEITSVSKKKEPYFDAPAAVFVITGEDIRRAGVTHIADALRMAPGMEVGRIDTNTWAVSARGFNGNFANKLLVMIDGRSVYSPLYSGVYWDMHNPLLEDIDRIEVIRGPGATLWGANAVNGVVNIITRHGKDTVGGLVTGAVGTEERVVDGARYGLQIGEQTFARCYVRHFIHDEGYPVGDREANDDWRAIQGGFRLDTAWGGSDAVTIQGDIYDGNKGEYLEFGSVSNSGPHNVLSDDLEMGGGNLLTHWHHVFSARSEIDLQFYYDRTERKASYYNEVWDTLDVDFQHRFQTARHELIWGLRYRLTHDRLPSSEHVQVNPESRTTDLVSGFVQDEIRFFDGTVRLIPGAKFEHNDYTGFEFQPGGRLIWQPGKRHAIWGSVSKAVRTPSRGEDSIDLDLMVIPPESSVNPTFLPILVRIEGNPEYGSERLTAYEAGYRFQASEALFFDIAFFFHDYKDLVKGVPVASRVVLDGGMPHIVLVEKFFNDGDAESIGVELAMKWRIMSAWQLHAAFNFLDLDIDTEMDIYNEASPRHQLSVRSTMDLPGNTEFDLWFRFVDKLSAKDVDGYATLDARLGWFPADTIELSLMGKNLLEERHQEFMSGELTQSTTEIQRSVSLKLSWHF